MGRCGTGLLGGSIFGMPCQVVIRGSTVFVMFLQAALVRELKSLGGVAKDKVDMEVKRLLELKAQLGVAPAAKSGKKAKKNKSVAK